MNKYKFNISITEKCNLHCPHCYTRNKTGSLTFLQVDTILDNLANGLTRVKIEGGEPYCERELFYHTIRGFSSRFPQAEIRVNSNGVAFYADKDTILREADMLYSLGVRRLRVSLDKFHEQGGADLRKVAQIQEVLLEKQHPLDVRYMSIDQALPIGVAEDLPASQKERRNCMNDKGCLQNPYFFCDIRGNVFTCCWRLIPPLGNLLTGALENIWNRMDATHRTLASGDVKAFATTDGLRQLIEDKGECMLCKEVFGREQHTKTVF